jgi:hypothetical protein
VATTHQSEFLAKPFGVTRGLSSEDYPVEEIVPPEKVPKNSSSGRPKSGYTVLRLRRRRISATRPERENRVRFSYAFGNNDEERGLAVRETQRLAKQWTEGANQSHIAKHNANETVLRATCRFIANGLLLRAYFKNSASIY